MSVAEITFNAELVVEQLRPLCEVDFGYNLESVQWLEGYIERLRQSGAFRDTADKRKLASMFGSFLGECVVRCYGGTWTRENDDWCVAFDEENAVYPFAKVRKQMTAGVEEGIGDFFRMIPVLFRTRSQPPAR